MDAERKRAQNRERQRRFWSSKTPEERRQLRLRYAVRSLIREEIEKNAAAAAVQKG